MLLDKGPPVSGGQIFMMKLKCYHGDGGGDSEGLWNNLRAKMLCHYFVSQFQNLNLYRLRLKIQLEFCIEQNTTLAM